MRLTTVYPKRNMKANGRLRPVHTHVHRCGWLAAQMVHDNWKQGWCGNRHAWSDSPELRVVGRFNPIRMNISCGTLSLLCLSGYFIFVGLSRRPIHETCIAVLTGLS